jgi:carbonic anhydrase
VRPIKAAIDNVKLGNITSFVNRIKPAVKMTKIFSGEKSSKNQEYVHAVCENNVINTIKDIIKGSKILKDLEGSGQIKIIGAVYDMDNGRVVFN